MRKTIETHLISPRDVKRGMIIGSSKGNFYVKDVHVNRRGAVIAEGMLERDIQSKRQRTYTLKLRSRKTVITHYGNVSESDLNHMNNTKKSIIESHEKFRNQNWEDADYDGQFQTIKLKDGSRAMIGSHVIVQFANGQFTCELGNRNDKLFTKDMKVYVFPIGQMWRKRAISVSPIYILRSV